MTQVTQATLNKGKHRNSDASLPIQRRFFSKSVRLSFTANPTNLTGFSVLAILSLFLLLIPVKNLLAAANIHLYDVTMPVVDESTAVRSTAFSRGLEEVFIRLSGDSRIASSLKMPSAGSYVKQYSYKANDKPDINDNGELLTAWITVQYNGTRIIEYLRKNGFPVWGEHRSELIVWMAVRDGRSQYVLKNADDSLIKSVTSEALRKRGVPSRWPVYDAEDKKKVSFADIRGGFLEPLTKASGRYGRGPVLSASLSWTGSSWQSEWTLVLNTSEYRWSHKGGDYQQLIKQSIGQVVDKMGQIYAVRDRAAGESSVSIYLDVNGIDNVSRYKRTSDYLLSMPAVNSVGLSLVDSERVVFVLGLRSSEEDFLNLLKNDGELIEVEGANLHHRGTIDLRNPAQVESIADEPLDLETLHAMDKAAANSTQPPAAKAAETVKALPEGDVPAGTVPVMDKPVYYFRLSK